MIQEDFRQLHYIVYELELPYCSVCTSSLSDGSVWNTPLTCEESSDSTYKLFFTSNESPLIQQPSPSISGKSILNSKVFRCVNSSTESTAKLKTGEGLASRSTMSIKCEDFKGDSGPINFSDEGTFFGKLMARNVLNGKKITSRYYTVIDSQSAPIEVYTATHFIESYQLTNNIFTISAKDALKDIEALTQQFPQPSEITLTTDINSSVTTIPVDDSSLLTPSGVIRIDDELMIIDTIDSPTSITVLTRGTGIIGADAVVFKTRTDDHSENATVQPCYVMNDSFLPDVLQDIFNFSGLSAFVDYAQWSAEITEWNADADLYGVFHTPEDVDSLINRMCSDYMIDMWLDQPSQKVKIGAISAWKQAEKQLYEGDDLNKLKSVINSTDRFSRAYIYSGKDYKTDNDDLVNYSRLTLATDIASESSDLNGDIKLKVFDPSNIITSASATILVNRFISRFSEAPKTLNFEMEERKLADLSLGDIVDVYSRDKQSPSGQIISAKDRAQIVKIQPNLNTIGRVYNISAISYIPEFIDDGNEIVKFISGTRIDGIDLYAELGGPNFAVQATFILDAAIIGSPNKDDPAISAGALMAGSRVKIIMTNGSQWAAKGGDGGDAGNDIAGNVFADDGVYGANSYESNGIESHIYINYGVVDTYPTSGEVYAAGGGGGAASQVTFLGDVAFTALSGGGGGSGIPLGVGGSSLPVIVPSQVLNVFSEQGASGSFDLGGSGASFIAGDPASFAYAGDGGQSIDSSASTAGSSNGSFAVGAIGVAGGAFKGTNITVYNLAADAAKLRDGNSDAYTLVTV